MPLSPPPPTIVQIYIPRFLTVDMAPPRPPLRTQTPTPQVITTINTGKLFYCGVFHPDDGKQNVLMSGCGDKRIYQFDLNTGDVEQVRVLGGCGWRILHSQPLITGNRLLPQQMLSPHALRMARAGGWVLGGMRSPFPRCGVKGAQHAKQLYVCMEPCQLPFGNGWLAGVVIRQKEPVGIHCML